MMLLDHWWMGRTSFIVPHLRHQEVKNKYTNARHGKRSLKRTEVTIVFLQIWWADGLDGMWWYLLTNWYASVCGVCRIGKPMAGPTRGGSWTTIASGTLSGASGRVRTMGRGFEYHAIKHDSNIPKEISFNPFCFPL
eukprot:5404332-Amphidinium_carterae.1